MPRGHRPGPRGCTTPALPRAKRGGVCASGPPSQVLPAWAGASEDTTPGAATTGQDDTYQAFPDAGPLTGNINLDANGLIRRLGRIGGDVYCYVLTTVKSIEGRFGQTGSGPNFQGGLITLCTCKGMMRAGRPVDAWRGVWIAGMTGAEAGPAGRGHLFYLMRVESAFESHLDLWTRLSEYSPETAEAKAADKHRLGDVYRPRNPCGNPFDPADYVSPCPTHVHRSGNAWHRDIDHIGYGRRPVMLVGDPHRSFLWSEPRVPAPFQLGRGSKVIKLDELLPCPWKANVR